ncbi:hypothetical protein C3432_12605 [Citrobacter amalonaticus]|uniref:DUF2799 domain-containing protein n=1 Tax=Citrobacter amalonaticus TaxID=35703 RepID=A0A2S4RQG6_CITAM|nr:DUF2799 domain-containing protein [Citrobacter amalonaticus]POT56280.1 hypothetical protein C3432_12605 [Citrobacter amalonaticus]POT74804.1 hypothetical protein C3436_13075 [Citrobacter amalonaticus]POU60053.1 hypothetical protein C3430_26010 [Citrobacter amalonaticus]POV02464.1 hypothetical protein C3424_26210 [Citrobacter amalonaticus]
MKRIISTIMMLFLSGCQIDPYTYSPNWTGTDWYDAGIEDAIAGFAVKDNEMLADMFNDPDVNREQYLKGYTEGQRKTCQQDFAYARGLTGKTFPASCDTVENTRQLREAWQKGADENAASTRLN